MVVYGAKKGDKTLAMSAKHTSVARRSIGEYLWRLKIYQFMFHIFTYISMYFRVYIHI